VVPLIIFLYFLIFSFSYRTRPRHLSRDLEALVLPARDFLFLLVKIYRVTFVTRHARFNALLCYLNEALMPTCLQSSQERPVDCVCMCVRVYIYKIFFLALQPSAGYDLLFHEAAVDLRLRPRGHWDRHIYNLTCTDAKEGKFFNYKPA
jgi:hypothetical protein